MDPPRREQSIGFNPSLSRAFLKPVHYCHVRRQKPDLHFSYLNCGLIECAGRKEFFPKLFNCRLTFSLHTEGINKYAIFCEKARSQLSITLLK